MFEHHRHEEYWQGDYTKWNIAKNVLQLNSVIFVHYMLQAQITIFTEVSVPALQRIQTRTWSTALLSRYTNRQALASGVHNDCNYLGLLKIYYLKFFMTEKHYCRRILFHAIIFLHESWPIIVALC